MACFAGCFSRDVAGSADQQSKQAFYASGASADASGTFGANTSLPAASQQSQKGCRGSLDPFSGGSGNKKHAPPSRSASSSSGSWDSTSSGSSAGSCRREELREACLAYGSNIMAVSTLQQDKLEYFVIPGIGYIAYAMMFNGPEFLHNTTAVALADPVCAPQHRAGMAEAFLQQHPKAMWCQVTAGFASVLQDLGFSVNSMGRETRLDVATYGFTGYARRGLRSAISAATKEGIQVQEVMHPPAGSLGGSSSGAGAACKPAGAAGHTAGQDWSVLAVEMRDVGLHWAASKTGRASSFWFINRPPVFAPEPGVRKFVARDATGRLLGYIFFDGVFEGGQLVGYYANVTRLVPDAHPGTLNLIVKAFLETIRAEAQLAAPTKKLSVKKSLLRKQAAAAAAAVAAAAGSASSDTAPGAAADQRQLTAAVAGPAAAGPASGPAPARPQQIFLSLGLSPFCQMDNSGFNSCDLTHKAFEGIFKHGEAFYPFKSLAAAKAKYGAGLHNSRAEDPGVIYSQAYFCHRRPGKTALVAAFDFAKLCGLWDHPADAAVQYVKHKVKTRLSKHRRGSSSSKGPLSSSVSTDATSFSSGSSGSKLRAQQMQKQAAAGAAAAAAAAAGVGCGGKAKSMAAAHGSAASLIGTAPYPAGSEGGNDLSSASVGTSVSTAVSAAGSEITALTAGSNASSTTDGA